MGKHILQIVLACQLGHSISSTAVLVGCSPQSAVVRTYQKGSKEVKTVNRQSSRGATAANC